MITKICGDDDYDELLSFLEKEWVVGLSDSSDFIQTPVAFSLFWVPTLGHLVPLFQAQP